MFAQVQTWKEMERLVQMVKIKYVKPRKSQENKVAAPAVPDSESDTSEMSDALSNVDPELNDDVWDFDDEDEAEKQGNEDVVGGGDNVEEVPEQVVDEMDIDRDGDEDEKEETEEELLDQIKTNWGSTSLRSIMELGLVNDKKKQLKDTWLSGETDLADEEWDMITLRLFRDLSRLTRNNFDKARSILGEWLRYRKHDKDGKRTGSKRVIKELKLRNDLRGIIYELQTTKEKARKTKDKEQGIPKRKKAKTDDDSSDVEINDGLYLPEVEPPLEKKGKKASEKKDSSKTPGGKSVKPSRPRRDSEDDSDSSPSEVPPKNPRKEKNAEAGVKVKKKPAQPKKNAQAKAKAAEAEDAESGSPAIEPPAVVTIQNEEERDAALEYIYTTWRTTSLLHVLPDALRPVEATKDQDLAYEIIAALRNLSNVIRTPDELAAFRRDLEEQVTGDTPVTSEDIVAHIARVGEPYYHAARAARENARHPVVRSAAGEPQTEGPTTRRSPRNHDASAIPPAGDQQAAAAPALDLLAAAAAGRLREIVTTPQPPRLGDASVTTRAPQVAPGASAATQDQNVARSNDGNEGTAQQFEQRTTQEEAGSRDATGKSSTANNTQGHVQPPQPSPRPVDQQPSRSTATIRDNDITFRLVSALSRVRNSEADVRVAQIQRDIAALQGQSAYAQANASLEVALKERQRAEAEMEANSFQGNREGMQGREEVARQREQELVQIRRGDDGDAVEEEEEEDSRRATKRRRSA